MDKLNYAVLEKSGYDGYILKDAPVKVLQFGEGNFLRAFVDYWFDMSNEKAGWNGKVALVQPIAQGLTKLINEQEEQMEYFSRCCCCGCRGGSSVVCPATDKFYNTQWRRLQCALPRQPYMHCDGRCRRQKQYLHRARSCHRRQRLQDCGYKGFGIQQS